MHTTFWSGYINRRVHLSDADVDGRTLYEETGFEGMD